MLPKGHRIGEYEIVRVLGAGGFGITYLAFDLHLDGPVAIKEYFPATVATRIDGPRVAAARPEDRAVFAWGLDRFIDEARSIHRFRHPNVVRAHRYVEAHDTAYIVMEYVEGASLKEILKSRGALPAPEWRRWLHPLLDGLAHVHGHGYLHRDVKPTNIVIRAADGEPVLIDFGAARVAAREQTHTRVLTPGYAPIEQYSTQAVQSPATDIYALAAVSYRVLTGAPPPDAPDRMLDDRYEPLSTRVAKVDRTWLASIDWALSLRSKDRPQSVTAWRMALTRRHNEPARPDAGTAESGTSSVSWKERITGFWWSDDEFARLFQDLVHGASAVSPDSSRFWRGCGPSVMDETLDAPATVRLPSQRPLPVQPRRAVGRARNARAARNPPTAAEPGSDSTRRTCPLEFEHFSRLTGRWIAYGGAHAVPIDEDTTFSSHDGYVNLIEDCYIEMGEREDAESSLPEQEESLLMTLYSMYSALQCGDYGFDRIVDEVLARLRDEDDPDDTHESWWRDGEFREIESHLVRGLERCGEDRTEVRGYVSSVGEWIDEYQDLRGEPDDLESLVSDIEASTASTAEHLSASAAWFDEWEKSKYAVDVFFECIRQLRLLHQNRFEAARTRVERAISETAGSRAKL